MIAILHNIRSLHNVGSMFRTADAAGVEKIYLTGYSPAPLDRLGQKRAAFAKVSLGAENTVAWEKTVDIGKLIRKLKSIGCKIYAVEQDKRSVRFDSSRPPASPAGARSKNKKIVLIFGNEVRGLSKQILKQADKILEIPMRGKKESLNVSVAFGIVAYRFVV